MDETGPRKIIHIDMDAFYASVEVRDRPQLRGQPVVVGGSPRSRGVVAAASYEARRYGIHSAMPCAQAYRLCPQAVFIPPDFAKYRAVSQQIQAIFRRYTELVEPLALDEAYLDVTRNRRDEPSATRLAAAIKAEIRAGTQLTASAGVAANKFLAKVASEEKKPDGLFVIRPRDAAAFLERLPVAKVPGVGRVTLAALEAMHVRTCGDLRRVPLAELVHHFGVRGEYFHRIARGIDDRPVNPHRERKSVGIEDTFAADHAEPEWLEAKLRELCDGLARRLAAADARGRTVTVKLRLADFSTHTRSATLPQPVAEADRLYAEAVRLLHASGLLGRPMRLLGVQVSHLHNARDVPERPYRQLELPWAEEA